MSDGRRVAVIGGGAAGMLAAVRAARLGASVTLFERNDRPGRKLRITGKGRCNLVNNCSREEFLENVPGNPRFLYTALDAFPPSEVMRFFEELGVPLKTERGKRVFPVSDRAQDVVDALVRELRASGVKLLCGARVTSIEASGGGITLRSAAGDASFDAAVLATGGLSYPLTGSDGDGYRLAERLGVPVTPLRGSLVPLEADKTICVPLMGLSLKNIALTVRDERGRAVFSEPGELLFTHFGLSGPLVLSASASLDFTKHSYRAEIDLKPALDEKTLDARLLSDFSKYANRDVLNALGDLLPQKLISPMIALCGIDPRKKVHSVSREERRALREHLKCLTVAITGARPVREAIITAGGVAVKGIDPKTMESRTVPGLFFAGELIDCDGYTGGFNLGIAFSTAYLAGSAAAGEPYASQHRRKDQIT